MKVYFTNNISIIVNNSADNCNFSTIVNEKNHREYTLSSDVFTNEKETKETFLDFIKKMSLPIDSKKQHFIHFGNIKMSITDNNIVLKNDIKINRYLEEYSEVFPFSEFSNRTLGNLMIAIFTNIDSRSYLSEITH